VGGSVSTVRCQKPAAAEHGRSTAKVSDSGQFRIQIRSGGTDKSLPLFIARQLRSMPMRDIDIANLSICPSVRNVPVLDENGLTYRHGFSPYGSPIILV